MKILIVDDHEVVRQGVSSLLRRNGGYDICGEAADGREAIRQARELCPEVIVMDISMPNLNGLEPLERSGNFSRTPKSSS